jgi:hypothetical protein
MKKNLVRQQATWSEEFSTGGRQLVTLIERLVEKGNARRLIIIKPSGRVLLDTSLTTGVAVAGVFTIMAPVLTALGAMTALLTQVRVRVIYTGSPPGAGAKRANGLLDKFGNTRPIHERHRQGPRAPD